MEFTYEITEEEYLQFNIYCANQTRQSKSMKVFIKWGFGVFFVLVGYILPEQPLGMMIFGIAGVVWVALGNKIFDKSMYEGLKKELEERTAKYGNEFTGGCTLTFGQEFITDLLNGRKTEVGYSKVTSVVENNSCYYIFTGSITAFILPFRAFKGEQHRSEFVNFLSEKTAFGKKEF